MNFALPGRTEEEALQHEPEPLTHDRTATAATPLPPTPSRRRRPARRPLDVIVAVGVGGIAGALARELLSAAFPVTAGAVPWVTVAVNLSGSLALGFLLVLLTRQFPRARLARPLIGTGLIGAYTTFSTFMVQAIELMRQGNGAGAVAYLVVSLVGGLAATVLGMATARLVVRAERWLQEGGG